MPLNRGLSDALKDVLLYSPGKIFDEDASKLPQSAGPEDVLCSNEHSLVEESAL